MSDAASGSSHVPEPAGASLLQRAPLWLPPLVALAALALLGASAVWIGTGGRELADDAPSLLRLVRNPFALWSSFRETGLWSRWGSFPPLLPPLFGLGVAPWLPLVSDFWAIRLGALTWSGVALVSLHAVLGRLERVQPRRIQTALWSFALLPSVWGAIAFIPQEEVFVSLFALALFVAARTGRYAAVPWLLAATALGGKYFLLILCVPLALASPRPLRNLILWGGVGAGTLAAYIGYHWLRFGLTPIVSHVLGPEGSISLWALLWNLGVQLPLELIRTASVALACSAVLAFCWAGARRGLPLVFLASGSLYLTLLCISITFPAYVLWVVPLALIAVTQMPARAHRVATIGLMFLWSAGEWSSNFFRGIGLALASERAPGKEVFAARVDALLGPGFPYDAVNTVCVGLVAVSGIGLVLALWRAGARAEARAAARSGARAPR